MTSLPEHVALALSVTLILLAAGRIAGVCGAEGMMRLLAAAPIAGALATAEAVVLGVFGLGASTVALGLAAAATWAAATRLPRPQRGALAVVLDLWRDLSLAQRLALGAAAGAVAGLVAQGIVRPFIGTDGLTYHLPEALTWVRDGHPGSIHTTLFWDPPTTDPPAEIFTGDIPVSFEVLVAWSLALSRGLLGTVLLMGAMFVLLLASAWAALRALRVDRPTAALAVIALATIPPVLQQVHDSMYTDLPAAAWLTCALALLLASRSRPRLAAVCVVAVGLAVGTKPTALQLGAAVVVALLVIHRRRLRELAPWLGAATALAMLAGGLWYVRTTVIHGSPLWPVAAVPWGDPTPPTAPTASLLANLSSSLGDGRLSSYHGLLGGAIVLLAAAPVIAAASRRRPLVLAGAGVVLAVLLWTMSPVTGMPAVGNGSIPLSALGNGALSATRYLLPAIVGAVIVLAVAATLSPRLRLLVGAALALAILVNLAEEARRHLIQLPIAYVTAGAALGVAVALWLRPTGRREPHVGWALGAALVVGCGVALSAMATGFVDRHARAGAYDAEVVRWFLAQPAYASDAPIAMQPAPIGALAGDDLRHAVITIPAEEPCSVTRRRAVEGWVVVGRPEPGSGLPPLRPERCLADRRPLKVFDGGMRVYGPGVSAR